MLRNVLWEEYKAYRNKSYNRWIKNNQHDWQLQRHSERERCQQLLTEKRIQHASILSHNWRGQGEVLQALRAVHAAQSVQKKLRLQQEIAAKREKLKDKYSEKPFRSWREFCETRAREGRCEAISAWRGFRYRDRRKKKSAHQLLPEEDSLLSPAPPKPFLNLDDFFCFIHEDGQVDYFDRKTQILSFSDHGDSVHVFQEQDDRVLEAALRIALEKWGRVQVKGDEAFKERIHHMAVRIRADKKVIRDPFSALDALRGLLSSSEAPVPPLKPSQKPSVPPEEEPTPRSSSSRSSSFKP